MTTTGQDYWLISADDHLVEAPTLWQERLPDKYLDVAPRIERQRGRVDAVAGGSGFKYTQVDDDDAAGTWCDVWRYEDKVVPIYGQVALAGSDEEELGFDPISFDDMRPGCYEAKARLEDMDVNRVEASVCFPNTFVRFAGQVFLEAKDKELALLGVRAYNDWVMGFSADAGGRVIPASVIPLWDPQLAAAEVERIAAMGCKLIVFPELPFHLKLPTLHTDHWDPLLHVCSSTGTVISVHTGSSSQFQTTSDDAVPVTPSVLTFVNPLMSLTDWIMSGTLERFPQLRVFFAECEVGWLPYSLQRMDRARRLHWKWGWGDRNGKDVLPEMPTTYFERQVMCAFAEDTFANKTVEAIGTHNVAFEVDYPHAGGTWPHSYEAAFELLDGVDPAAQRRIIRENAINFLDLDIPL